MTGNLKPGVLRTLEEVERYGWLSGANASIAGSALDILNEGVPLTSDAKVAKDLVEASEDAANLHSTAESLSNCAKSLLEVERLLEEEVSLYETEIRVVLSPLRDKLQAVKTALQYVSEATKGIADAIYNPHVVNTFRKHSENLSPNREDLVKNEETEAPKKPKKRL